MPAEARRDRMILEALDAGRIDRIEYPAQAIRFGHSLNIVALGGLSPIPFRALGALWHPLPRVARQPTPGVIKSKWRRSIRTRWCMLADSLGPEEIGNLSI